MPILFKLAAMIGHKMNTERILYVIHLEVRTLVNTLVRQAQRDGFEPPYKIQILHNDKPVEEFAVAGVDAWSKQYEKLVPLAATANPSFPVEFILTPGGKRLTTVLDFSHVEGDWIIESRLI
jgi:hypothetical protein